MRSPTLRRADRAAVDIPFKLLISVILMALATAILLPVVKSYQQSEVEHRIEVTVAEITAAARAVYQHPGSSRTVLVNVEPAGPFRLERLRIGGDLRGSPAEAGVIRWEQSSGTTGSRVVSSSSGPIPMAGPDLGSLVVEGGPYLLVLESKDSPEGSWCRRHVEVRTV